MTLPTEDVAALVADLQNVLTDWNGADIPDAELPRVDVLCGTLRLAATALSILAGERDADALMYEAAIKREQESCVYWCGEAARYNERAEAAEARATTAEAQVVAMREALEPFDDALGEDDEGYGDGLTVVLKWGACTDYSVTLADLREARRARESLSRQEGGR